MDKKLVMLGMVFGSTVGGYIPTLFGASAFSFASIFWGVIGIWLSYKLVN